MKNFSSMVLGATLLSLTLLVSPSLSLAQQAGQREDSVSQPRRPNFFHILGSIVFTPIHLVAKTVTCVGTQATAAVAYTTTYGVEGHYDGGTNGRDIGETARRSCTGSWIVRPSQVVRDYGE
jgi:hypothetical protein